MAQEFNELHSARILVVASDQRLRIYLSELLIANFGDVHFVDSGAKAEKLLNKDSFDVVISDFFLSDMTGVEFREVMAKKHTQPFFILLTGHAMDPRIQERVAKDHFLVLQKPPHADELVLQIRSWFRVKKAS